MARTGVFDDPPDMEESVVDAPMRGRPTKHEELKPIAPYDSDPAKAIKHVINRVTGELISPEKLKAYAEALCQYHLSSEDKFANGQFLDRGLTERRHVVAKGIALIGKEANRVGETGEADPIFSAVEQFEAVVKRPAN